MRIDRLDLIAYGPFTAKSLDLTEGNSGLHLIYGDNEAGKSTSLRALVAMLFGIPQITHDSFLHDNSQLRIGGKLKLSDGKMLEFVRKKGRKNTLLSPDTGTVLDDKLLLPFLPDGIDDTLFLKLYGIDHDSLIAGGKDLLDDEGELGKALAGAATGSKNLRELLNTLKGEADALFRPRGSTPEINKAIADFKAAQKRSRDALLSVTDWKDLQRKLEDMHCSIEKLEETLSHQSREKKRLERLSRVKVALGRRRNLLNLIQELASITLLPEDFTSRYTNAVEKIRMASETRKKAEAALQWLNNESATLAVNERLIENEKKIERILTEQGVVEKALEKRPRQDGALSAMRKDAEKLLKGLRPDVSPDKAGELRILLAGKKRITGLAKKYDLMLQKKENAKETLRKAESDKTRKEKELEQLKLTVDMRELRAAIASVRKAGDIEERCGELRNKHRDATTACDREFKRLGRYTGSVETLITLPLPVPATLDDFEKRFEERTNNGRDITRSREVLADTRRKKKKKLNSLLKKGEVPTISKLEDARSERDSGWNLVKKKFIEHIDVEEEIAEISSDDELPRYYERKVEAADQVADTLRVNADKVAERALMEKEIDELDMLLEACNNQESENDKQLEVLDKEWDDIWKQYDINPASPREMKQWLDRVGHLETNFRALETLSRDVEKCATDCSSHRTTVSAQLEKLGETADVEQMSLEAMLNLCEERLAGEDELHERRRSLIQSLEDITQAEEKSVEELRRIEEDRGKWASEWSEVTNGLTGKIDIHPEQATEAIEQLVLFFDKYDKSEELTRKIAETDEVISSFNRMVYDFADSIGYEKENRTAMDVSLSLHTELKASRDARAKLEKNRSRESELRQEIENSNISIQGSEEILASLRKTAGVTTNDELELAGENSGKKRMLQKELEIVEDELTRNGDGLSIEQLEKEAGEADMDAVDSELASVNREIEELNVQRDHLLEERRTIQNDIDAKDGNAFAANAYEEAQQSLSSIVSGTEQYLRLRFAAHILEQRIDEYRKKNQAPVLARAGKLFSRFTGGSFVKLQDDIDDKNNRVILSGIRSDNRAVPIEGMSDGTRDQLYLSLRLATLEQHMGQSEPIPFVVDDILIGFDDKRTKTCLEVLTELAERTQILLFTHHRRVAEIASGLTAPAGVFVHEL